MKKNIRRWLALCLALVLVFSLTVVAAAATTASLSFSDVTGAYTITMTRGSQSNKVTAIPNATGFGHTYGYLTALTEQVDYNVTHTVSITSYYAPKLETLLGEVGLRKSCKAIGNTGPNFFVVNANQPTGTYKLAVGFECYNAPWTLVLDEPYSGTANTGESGTVSKAPVGDWYITILKVS